MTQLDERSFHLSSAFCLTQQLNNLELVAGFV